MPNNKIAKFIKLAAVTILGICAILWAAWLVAVPSSVIQDRVISSLKAGGIEAEFTGFKKGLLFSVKAESLTLSSASKDYATIDNLGVSLRLSSLVVLRPTVVYSAEFSDGELRGSAWGRGKEYALSLNVTGIDLSKAGLDKMMTGLRAKGKAKLSLELETGTGKMLFTATELAFSPYKYMGFPLPLDLARTLRASVTLNEGIATIESVSLDGEGIYARLQGTIARRNADLTLVLTPEPEFEQSLTLFSLLKKYEVTTGRYEIPIKRSF